MSASAASQPHVLRTFVADVTVPIGHPLMGGGIEPARSIADRLEAIGFVLSGGGVGAPIVLVALDWCEIRNDAYDRWRAVLAEAAATEPERVFVTATHVHDAPIVDLTAQRLLEENGCEGKICDRTFHEQAVTSVAEALRISLRGPGQVVTHIGAGRARVRQVASNRRYERPDGSISYGRTSATADQDAHRASEGTVDPWLRALSFWNLDQPLLVLNHFAVHPMSNYGVGLVSADFPGIARRRRQAALPDTLQLYVSGCSGNITAGKYNDGAPENRQALAGRLEHAMADAWGATERFPLQTVGFRVARMHFEPRSDHTERELMKRLTSDRPFDQCLAALGLSWGRRLARAQAVDLPALDLGHAILLLLPGETYVEYQLLAQRLRPGVFVMALGYGESGPGYIPTARQVTENDGNLRDWCWVAPSAERVLTDGLSHALG